MRKIYEAEMSGCKQLSDKWHTWIRQDMQAWNQCRTGVIHFVDGDRLNVDIFEVNPIPTHPSRKPWTWRFWPIGGYYQMWHEVASELPNAWTDTLQQVCMPQYLLIY